MTERRFEIRHLTDGSQEQSKESKTLLILNGGLSNKVREELETALENPDTAMLTDALETFTHWKRQELKPDYANVSMYVDSSNNIGMRQILSLLTSLSLLEERPTLTIYHPQNMTQEKINDFSESVARYQHTSHQVQVDIRPIPETKVTN